MLPPDNILAYLDHEKTHYHILHHPLRVPAQRVAAAAHVPGFRMAKTVVVKHDDAFALAIVPAPELLDLEQLEKTIGGSWRLATEAEFAGLFPDCEVGAMPALGSLYGLPVFVDTCLAAQDTICFNAGTHEDLVELPFDEFARLTRPRVVDFGRR